MLLYEWLPTFLSYVHSEKSRRRFRLNSCCQGNGEKKENMCNADIGPVWKQSKPSSRIPPRPASCPNNKNMSILFKHD